MARKAPACAAAYASGELPSPDLANRGSNPGPHRGRAQEDFTARLEIEPIGFAPRDLHPYLLPVGDRVDADLKAQPHHPHDSRGHGLRLAEPKDLDVVRPHCRTTELGDRTEEVHHEIVHRLVVQLVGGSDLLDGTVV